MSAAIDGPFVLAVGAVPILAPAIDRIRGKLRVTVVPGVPASGIAVFGFVPSAVVPFGGIP